MLDRDLAVLYEVTTGNLNLAVRRNLERFPEDFMFRLTTAEFESLRLQSATSSWGGRRYIPYAFTEHGIAMLSAVLRSKRAIQMSISIVRAFVQLREMIATHRDLGERIEKLEKNQGQHASVITLIAEEIEAMKELPPSSTKKIGFNQGDE